MVEFICENCRYRFNSEKACEKNPCPYCGEKAVKKEESISDILNNIE